MSDGCSLRFSLACLAVGLAFAAGSLDAQVVINEVLASNRLVNVDDDRDSSDWVELFNVSSDFVELKDFGISDDAAEPRKWILPDVTMAPGSYLLVWCSGKDRSVPRSEAIIQVDSPVPFEPALVSLDATWRYLTGLPTDAGPPLNWKDPEFDDSLWSMGKPGFGFGDDDDTTALPPGIGAVFLRHQWQLDARRMPRSLVLEARFDDGFVTYINGVRVLSVNFTADTDPQFSSLATTSAEARTLRRFDLTPHLGVLKPGTNTIAMVALNRTVISDDLSLIPELGIVRPVLHTNFKLAESDEAIVLTNASGIVVDTVVLPPQYEDQSHGRSPDGTGPWRYLLQPTPLGANVGPAAESPLIVADTKFSVDRGFFDAPFDLELRTETAGAEIRFTTNGSVPTATTGTVYSAPLRIDRTTVLRAAAFKPDHKPTNIDTHTYLFLDDVLEQDSRATLAAGFPPTWNGTPPDYGMDPDVIGSAGTDKYGGKYRATVKDDLQAVSTISIVMNIDDLFGAKGIYSNPEARGVAWERPTSVELIDAAGGKQFHVNAGIRIQGGAFRSHGLTKKHSFRLVFKSLYGDAKLDFPLFKEITAADKFDTLTLRVNSNDGWQWNAATSKPLYIRDTFGRETMLDLGGVSSHHRFTHLYLNGFYWGLYEIVERPDASFSATYFGGEKDEWDAMSNDQVAQGTATAWNTLLALARAGFRTNALYQAVQGLAPDGTDDPKLENYLDVKNLADYMIVNLYVGNTDWPFKNWWTSRRRVDSTGFKFHMWDSEWSLGLQSDVNTNQTGVNTGVAVPYGAARGSPEFRLLFADRLHRHFFNGGALHVDPKEKVWDPQHPERNVPAARFVRLAAEVERPLVAESARWGDQHAARPYTRDEHWRTELNTLLRTYFPQRSANVLQQFRGAQLYPAVEAPVFNRHGGRVAAGFALAIRGSGGTVYYTLDGADPRLPGGDGSPTALQLESPRIKSLVTAGSEARYLVPVDAALGLDWTRIDFDDATWKRGPTGVGFEATTGLDVAIATRLEADEMRGKSASLYLRIPFTLDAPLDLGFLSLGMRYDDGYVAYLNGTRLASQNAPDTLEWSSQASRAHPDTQAVVPEWVDVTTSLGLLRPGVNVLAIHGLNSRATDDDFLIAAELEGLVPVGRGIVLEKTTLVKARNLVGSEWSALNEAIFVVDDDTPLRITELMYHPADPEPASGLDADDFEFIEMQNVGSKQVSLLGVRLTGGIELDLSTLTEPLLDAGAVMVLVKNREAFATRHDVGKISVRGEYAGKLGNDSDTIILRGRLDETLLEFTYSEDWYPETDGEGRSLEIRDPRALTSTWKDKASWRGSASDGGSPGVVEPGTGGEGGWQLAGDWNQDGRRNVTDAIRLLGRLYAGVDAPLPCEGASLTAGANLLLHDTNGDEQVNLGDVVHFLSYLFRAGPAPALGGECAPLLGCPDVCVTK